MIPVIGRRTSPINHVIVIAMGWPIGASFGVIERNLSSDTRYAITSFISPAFKWNLATILPASPLRTLTHIRVENQPPVHVECCSLSNGIREDGLLLAMMKRSIASDIVRVKHQSQVS